MAKYLGETTVHIRDTEFKDYTPTDWSMYFIEKYGQIDEKHHKQWLIDQIARILKGTPVIVKLAIWDNGKEEYRAGVGERSKEYNEWVKSMLGEFIDGEFEYSYDCGIAP